MSIPSIEERRKTAYRLADLAESPTPNWIKLMGVLGVNSREGALMALAEMIDPAPWERTVEDNHRLLDRCRELEIENARLKPEMERGGGRTMSDFVRLNYVTMPVTYDQSLDGIAYDYGDEGLGKALRLMCACASQQGREPFYMLDVTGEKGWSVLARRLNFDSVKECMGFISAMRSDGLCEIVKDGEREYVACQVVMSGIEGYKIRKERSKKAAEARWKKGNDEGGKADEG